MSESILESRFLISGNALCTEVDGESVILDMDKGCYFGLDEIGTHIWTLLGEGHCLREIISLLCQSYDIEEDKCQEDVVAISTELVREGLLMLA